MTKKASTKEAVLRVTRDEYRLIQCLRGVGGSEALLDELGVVLSPENRDVSPVLRQVQQVLNPLSSFEDLINIGSLTQQQVDLLKDIVDSGKSIIVTGQLGTGKTTIMNLLEKHQSQKVGFVALSEASETELTEDQVYRSVSCVDITPDNVDAFTCISNVLSLNLDELTARDMAFVENTFNYTTLYVSEVSTLEDLSILAHLLLSGKQVVAHYFSKKAGVLEDMLSRCEDATRKQAIMEMFNARGFVEVHCRREADGLRTVDIIQH